MVSKTLTLSNGQTIPTLGQGTWFMGEDASEKKAEIKALQCGIDAGITLIDTAEMYANGGSELVVGEAIAGRRDKLFLVSKVLPFNASLRGTILACEKSLARLQTDYLDMYLLHWPGSYPLEETFEAMEKLLAAGKIRSYGVSNFDTSDMKAVLRTSSNVVLNQVMYNLGARGIEYDLIPWHKQNNIATMAYSPLYQTQILNDSELLALAQKLGITAAQLAIAWLLHQGVIPIPKSSNVNRVLENAKAWDITLDQATLKALDNIFPPPKRKMPLAVL